VLVEDEMVASAKKITSGAMNDATPFWRLWTSLMASSLGDLKTVLRLVVGETLSRPLDKRDDASYGKTSS